MLKPNSLTGANVRTYSGLTWTVMSDGGLLLDGTTTNHGDSKTYNLTGKLKKGTPYSFYLKEPNSSIDCVFVVLPSEDTPGNSSYSQVYYGNYTSTGEENYIYCYLYASIGVTFNNEIIYPILEEGERKGFEPYFISCDMRKSIAEDETLTAVWGENLVNNRGFLGGNNAYTNYGVTYTYQPDGKIKAEGTANADYYADSTLIYIENIISLSESYMFICDEGAILSGCYLTIDGKADYHHRHASWSIQQNKSYAATFIHGNIESGYIYISVSPGTTVNNVITPALVVF